MSTGIEASWRCTWQQILPVVLANNMHESCWISQVTESNEAKGQVVNCKNVNNVRQYPEHQATISLKKNREDSERNGSTAASGDNQKLFKPVPVGGEIRLVKPYAMRLEKLFMGESKGLKS